MENHPTLIRVIREQYILRPVQNTSSGCFLSIWQKLVLLSLPWNPVVHRLGNGPHKLCPNCRKQDESHLHFAFHCRLSKLRQSFKLQPHCTIQYNLQIFVGASIIFMLTNTQKMLPSVLEVYLCHIFHSITKAFCDDTYCNRIKERKNYKNKPAFRLRKIRDTVIPLGPAEIFFKTWNFLLDTSDRLAVQFH